MIIRTAEKKDLPEIAGLAKKMIAYHRQLDSYYKAAEEYTNLESDFEEEMREPGSIFLVAADNGEIAGYFRGAIEKAPDYAAPKKIGVIYDLAVAENYRRRGIGQRLFAEALLRFKNAKIRNIELSVDARNQPAIKFWKSLGFSEHKLRLRQTVK